MLASPTQLDLPGPPPHKGSYVLLLELSHPEALAVGRLGALKFAAGLYAYAGSAHGPGGLAARLKHHLNAAKRCHWHLDYLRLKAPVVAVWAGWGRAAAHLGECRLVDRLARQARLKQPFKGFGSSDCACYSHLLHWPAPVAIAPPDSDLRAGVIARLDDVLKPMVRLRCQHGA